MIVISCITVIAFISFLIVSVIGYKAVAFLLLFTVSILALLFNIRAVFLSAILSALVWDFFFIPPIYTFSIGNTDDRLMMVMYFVLVLLNAVLTNKINQIEKESHEKKEKEKSIKLYNTLLNSLSHELRTPIATIIAATDNLQQNKINENQKEELYSQLIKASYRLNSQVENLLNMSRIDSGIIKLKKEWTDISEIIFEVLEQLKNDNHNRLIDVNIPSQLPLCKLDQGVMHEIIFNLIHNATTYVEKDKKIVITVNLINGKLILIIEDEGRGFPKDEIGLVFDKFYRLKNSRVGGLGLGLSIVKGYVDALVGDIKLENKMSGGAKFTITIPCETKHLANLIDE